MVHFMVRLWSIIITGDRLQLLDLRGGQGERHASPQGLCGICTTLGVPRAR
jgi:hypothetical protein